MLERNKRIKLKPERFQDSAVLFDLIVTCEERVYDQVVEGKLGYCFAVFHSVALCFGECLYKLVGRMVSGQMGGWVSKWVDGLVC